MQLKILLSLRLVVVFGLFIVLSGCSAESKNARHRKRAEKYFNAGEYEKAKIEYLNLLRAEPADLNAIQKLGAIWLEQGVPMRAIPFLLKSRELDPKNLDARKQLVTALRKLGNIQEGRKEAFEILKRDPANQEALLLLVATAMSEEEISATEMQLREAEKSAPVGFYLASAVISAKKGDLASAKLALQQALKMNPKSVDTHLMMSNILLLTGDQDGAASELELAASLSPLRSDARLKFAEFSLRTGDIAKARSDLNNIVEEAPDLIPAWVLLARIEFSEKKYSEALSKLENVFGRDGMNYDGRMLEVQVLLAKGDVAKALKTLERLDETYPNIPMTKLGLANAFQASGKPDQAIAVLEEALKLSPDYTEASLLLAELKLRTGDPEAVVAAMNDLLKKRPNLLKAQLLLAEAYRASGKLDDAAALLRESIAASPETAQPHFLLGMVLRQQEEVEEARKELEKALELAPGELAALSQLTALDLQKGDYSAALARVREQMERTPDLASVHFQAARIYAAQKNWDQAEAELQSAVEKDVNFGDAYDLLIGVYLASNRLTEAASQLEALLEKKPNDTRSRLILAMVYENSNEFAKAGEAYARVLAATPDSVLALNNLAWLYATQLNDLEKAYELATKAHVLKPEDGAISDTLGWTLYKRGDYKQAWTLLKDSAGKLSDVPEAQYHFGMASYMMGEIEMARTALRQATEAPAEFPGKEEALRRLRVIEYIGEGSGRLSLAEIEKYLEENPEDPIGILRLGETFEREGAFAKAAEAYESALKINPHNSAAAISLAKLYSGPLKNKKKALEFAKKARELAPSDPEVRAILGRSAYLNGDFKWAYSLLEESRRQSGNAAILCDFAMAAYCLGKVEEAELAMREVVNSYPDSPLENKAKIFLSMTGIARDPEAAVNADSEIEKELNADPEYLPALMARARVQEAQGDSKASIASYVSVLERDPDFAPAQKRLAALYAEDPENRAKAYELAMKARKALPDDPELLATLAEISYHRKDYADTVGLMQESAAAAPLDSKGFYYLGMAYLRLKDWNRSKEALQGALSSGLPEPFSGEARRALDEIEGKN